MYHQPIDKKELIRRITLYTMMTLSVVMIVSFIVLFISGYRFDSSAGRIEQYSMIQFNSVPSGAIVTIDGKTTKLQTPSKITLPAGEHSVSMSKPGYKAWSKDLVVKAGSLTWLSYAILVPNEIKVETIANYESIYESLTSPDNKKIIYNTQSSLAVFELADITADIVHIEKLALPVGIYSESQNPTVEHVFNIKKWDEGGRYVLINHKFGDKAEWLLIDVQDVNLTKNITKLFDFSIADINFLGTGGNTFYILSERDIRKINLLAGTISRPLVTDVDSFEVYDSNTVSYIGDNIDMANKIVGLYRDGDDHSYVVKTIEKDDDSKIIATLSKYFGQYYLVIASNSLIEIYGGSYPNSTSDISSMKLFGTFGYDKKINKLTFSPDGQCIVAQFDDAFMSYDIEYQSLRTSKLNGASVKLNWLNEKYLWQDDDSKLSILAFDGANVDFINPIISGQSAGLTNNNRYIYSFNKTDLGYQLQRARMIIPN